MTFYYIIKNRDSGLFKYTLRENLYHFAISGIRKAKICKNNIEKDIYLWYKSYWSITLESLSSKHTYKSKRSIENIFYKINLLLKYYIIEFKWFQSNRDLSQQESNKIFWLYTLLINILRKIRSLIN